MLAKLIVTTAASGALVAGLTAAPALAAGPSPAGRPVSVTQTSTESSVQNAPTYWCWHHYGHHYGHRYWCHRHHHHHHYYHHHHRY
ncbi:hypothetical protein AB0J52_23605 [Spirillospora sp. NPDC049652]